MIHITIQLETPEPIPASPSREVQFNEIVNRILFGVPGFVDDRMP